MSRRQPVVGWQLAQPGSPISPSPARREREGPTPKAWEGEGDYGGACKPPHPALSPGGGEGLKKWSQIAIQPPSMGNSGSTDVDFPSSLWPFVPPLAASPVPLL